MVELGEATIRGTFDASGIQRGARQAKSSMQGFEGTVQQSQSRMSSFRQGMQNAGMAMTRAGTLATAKMTVPLLGAAAAVGRIGFTFEEAMNRVEAKTGESGEAIERLEEQAKQLGETTSFSAQEAAEGMSFLAQAGFETNQILSAMPNMLNLARGGELELAEAADIASNVMTGFKMSAEESERVVDVLGNTAVSANTDVRQLGNAMSYASGITNSVGVEIEEASAIVGRLGQAGIQGSRAGTTLRRTMSTLLQEADSDEMAELGGDVRETAMSLLNAEETGTTFADFLDSLQEAGVESGEVMDMFGQRAGAGLVELLDQGSGALRELTEANEDAAGKMTEVSDTMNQGVVGAWHEMISAIKGLAIDVAQSGLIEIFTGVMEGIRDMFRRLAEVSPSTKRFALVILGLVAALGPLLVVLGLAVTAIGTLVGPVGVVVAAIGGLVAAFVMAYQESEAFRNIVNGVFRSVADVAGPILSWLGDQLETVGSWFGLTKDTANEEMKDMAGETVSQVTGMAQGIIDQANRLQIHNGRVSGEIAEKWITDIKKIRQIGVKEANKAFDDIKEAARILHEDLGVISGEQRQTIEEEAKKEHENTVEERRQEADEAIQLFKRLAENGTTITKGMVEEVTSAVNNQEEGVVKALTSQMENSEEILTKLRSRQGQVSREMAADAIKMSKKTLDETTAAAEERFQKEVDAAMLLKRQGKISEEEAEKAIREAEERKRGTIQAALEQHVGVVQEIQGMREDVGEELNLMTGESESFWGRFSEDIVEAAGKARDKALPAVGLLFDALRTGFSSVIRNKVAFVSALWDAAGTVIEVVGRLISQFGRLPSEVGRTLSAMGIIIWAHLSAAVSNIVSFISRAFSAAMRFGEGFVDGVTEGISGLGQLVREKIQGAIDAVGEMVSEAFAKAKEFGSNLWEGFKSGLGISSPSLIEEAIDSIVAKSQEGTSELADQVGQFQRLGNSLSTEVAIDRTEAVTMTDRARGPRPQPVEGGQGGTTIQKLEVNNPKPENTEETLPRTIRKLAYMGY